MMHKLLHLWDILSKFKINIGLILIIFIVGYSCEKDEPSINRFQYGQCSPHETIAKSFKNCNCSIQIQHYRNLYTFVKIESSYYSITPPCRQNVFKIKFTNSVHDHNEPDIDFSFYMPQYTNEEFFKIDTFQIDTMGMGAWSLSGGHGGPRYGVDVTFIWDSVKINDNIYSGKGKFIINSDIPYNLNSDYVYPAQEIPFEFCESRRTNS